MQTPNRPRIVKSGVIEKAVEPITKEWTFNFDEILSSPRKVKGKFHTPMIDKDNEYVQGEAVRNAVPDFMHLPILHDFHKERTVGIVTRVVELSDGSFDFEGLIKATDDCNDVWELIEKGNYDQVSIYGKRTCGSDSCSMRPEARKEPCVTTAVRLDSISVCDEKARNEGTSLFVAKGAKVVFNANEELIKAETTDSSLMHTVTDKPKKGYRINSKGEVIRTDTPSRATCPEYERQALGKGEDMNEVKAKSIANPMEGAPNPRAREKKPGKFDSMGRNYRPPNEERKGDEMEEASVEGEVEESIEEKLDKLEMVIEGLVQKDQEAKAKSGDIPKQDPGQSYELPPEAEREYGAPTPGETREDVEVEPVSPSPDGYDDVDKLAAHIHLTSKVGTGSEEKAGVPKISLTDRKTTSPEEVNHWKEQYEAGKPAYQKQKAEEIANKESLNQKRKEDFVNQTQVNESLNPDIARVDIKADPGEPDPKQDKVAPEPSQHKWETKDDKEKYKRQNVAAQKKEGLTADIENPDPKKPWAEDEKQARADKVKSLGKKQPPAPKDKGGKKLGSEDEAKENRAKIPPSKVEDTHPKDTKVYATVKDRQMAEPKHPTTPGKPDTSNVNQHLRSTTPPWKDVGGEPVGTERSKPLERGTPSPKIGSYESQPAAELEHGQRGVNEGFTSKKPAERSTPVTDKEKYGKWSSSPAEKQHPEDATKEPRFVPESKAGEMPDINSRLDRLIAVVAQLVQSDERVHEGMDNPSNEEEKAISKGTDTMKDEEVDLLVKAKVDAKVEEISKAYSVQVEELKKANTDLAARIEKMENETIEKSGVAVILREGDGELGTVLQSNAAAISAISKAQKSKV